MMNNKIIISWITLFFLFISVNIICSQEQVSLDDFLYREFKEVESFGYIHVKIQNEGYSAIELSSQELTDFARLKYKNNFADIPFNEISAEGAYLVQAEGSADKVGSIWFRVWIVGESFPMAYYIECRAGTYESFEIWRDEALGFCDVKEIKTVIKQEIASMMERLAIIFFKVRGEI